LISMTPIIVPAVSSTCEGWRSWTFWWSVAVTRSPPPTA
jgi:hypothetical protein